MFTKLLKTDNFQLYNKIRPLFTSNFRFLKVLFWTSTFIFIRKPHHFCKLYFFTFYFDGKIENLGKLQSELSWKLRVKLTKWGKTGKHQNKRETYFALVSILGKNCVWNETSIVLLLLRISDMKKTKVEFETRKNMLLHNVENNEKVQLQNSIHWCWQIQSFLSLIDLLQLLDELSKIA